MKFKLSDRLFHKDSAGNIVDCFKLSDVKEFISKVKDRIVDNDIYTVDEIFRIINELSGFEEEAGK